MTDNKTKMSDAQWAEIDTVLKQSYETKRSVSAELESILYQPINLLDHGFIRVIDYMGTDAAITQAARVSYGKGTKNTQNDKGLIKYLMRHLHTSPFEMCEIKFHIKAPIFVARQWIRHRTANVNEYSGRYSLMETEFYVPQQEHVMGQSLSNKQGRAETIPEPINSEIRASINNHGKQSFNLYHKMLHLDDNESMEENGLVQEEIREVKSVEEGLTRELARIVLPLNTYTEFYWKIDLHNLMHFAALRSTEHAQYEIRVYAQAIIDILKKWVPMTYESFAEYKQGAVRLSKEGHRVIQDILSKKFVSKKDYNLSKREWLELANDFDVEELK